MTRNSLIRSGTRFGGRSRRNLKLALVCFFLILPCYAFSLYVQINVQWIEMERGQ